MARGRSKLAVGAALMAVALIASPTPAFAKGTLDQSQTNAGSPQGLLGYHNVRGQSFAAGLTGTLDAVEVVASLEGADGAPAPEGDDATIALWATSGGLPTGSSLAQARVHIGNTVGVIEWTLSQAVTAGTVYAITLVPDQRLYLDWKGSCDGDAYTRGEALMLDNGFDPATWETLAHWRTSNQQSSPCMRDQAFNTYVTVAATPTPTPTPTPTATPAPTATPTPTPTAAQSVAGVTAQPTPHATMPPTTMATTETRGSSEIPLLLMAAMAMLLATVFVSARRREDRF